MRSPELAELMEHFPNALLLALGIALRARWNKEFSAQGLTQGQAFIGDYWKFGLTRQQYRTAKQNLTNLGFATFKSTNKGTVATLMDSRLFSLVENEVNQQNNHQSTNKQPLTKKDKKVQEENGDVSEVAALMQIVGDFYDRPKDSHWNYAEQSAICEIARRPNPVQEFELLRSYRNKLPEKDKKYFPQSVKSLIEKWDEVLDRARKFKEPKIF